MNTSTRTLKALAGALLIVTSTAALGAAYASVGTDPAPAPPAENKYIGAEKCKSCHSAAESGDQYGKWKAMKHAHAFESLASEEAKKIATEKGIADPQKADECLQCHVTAFKVPDTEIKKGFDRAHGIQCETCHGPGEKHMKARFATAAEADSSAPYVQVPADEIVTLPTMDVCVACHNEKATNWAGFCFHEFNAKIRHLNPRKPRTAIDLGTCTCPKCANGCPESCKTLAEVK